jgi:hypothetical protein
MQLKDVRSQSIETVDAEAIRDSSGRYTTLSVDPKDQID